MRKSPLCCAHQIRGSPSVSQEQGGHSICASSHPLGSWMNSDLIARAFSQRVWQSSCSRIACWHWDMGSTCEGGVAWPRKLPCSCCLLWVWPSMGSTWAHLTHSGWLRGSGGCPRISICYRFSAFLACVGTVLFSCVCRAKAETLRVSGSEARIGWTSVLGTGQRCLSNTPDCSAVKSSCD